MASLEEISLAVKILKKKNRIILMHCVSLYPTKLESNIDRIDTLKKKFKLEVGYSDHTLGSKQCSLLQFKDVKSLKNILR